MPCPTDLYIVLAHTSPIRYRAAFELSRDDELQSMTRQVLKEIESFDPVSWARKNEFATKEITLLIGQIYHAAVRLFATLTLPRAAVLATYPRQMSFQDLRTSQRRAVVALVKQGLLVVEYSNSLDWPMIVAGVAAGTAHHGGENNHDYSDALATQEFVDRFYYKAWTKPISSITAFLILQKLRFYWKSRKTEWDDCFHEPTAC